MGDGIAGGGSGNDNPAPSEWTVFPFMTAAPGYRPEVRSR